MKLKDLNGTWEAEAIFETDFEFQGIKMVYENREKIAEEIKKQVESQGCTDFKVEGNTCYFGNQFYNLPNLPEFRKGILKFRSKDYTFSCKEWHDGRESFGDKPKAANVVEDGFIVESAKGSIRYKLIRKIA